MKFSSIILGSILPLSVTVTAAPWGLPSLTPSRGSKDYTSAIVKIKQTMNLFGLLVDSHQYDRLDEVLTQDANADLFGMARASFKGLPAIQANLAELGDVRGLHGFNLQYVLMLDDTTANMTTYTYNKFFGRDDQVGKEYSTYGLYNTTSRLINGQWKITYIVLDLLVGDGDYAVVYKNETAPHLGRERLL